MLYLHKKPPFLVAFCGFGLFNYTTKNSAYVALSFGKTTIINRKGATPKTRNPCDIFILAYQVISVKPVENSPKKNSKKSQKMFRKTIAFLVNFGYT
jgi:hypothetical protein